MERHPELVEGPALDDAAIFFVSLAMRADGAVLSSAAELASTAAYTDVSERLQRTLPIGGGGNPRLVPGKRPAAAKGVAPRAPASSFEG